MDEVMLHSPILLRIAQSITDYDSFMAFMMVNKKFCSVAKYVVAEAPALYIANIIYKSSPYMKLNAKDTVFDSLRELFTKLHKAHLESPPKIGPRNGNGPWYIKNYAGPCDDCLSDWDSDECCCDDISYLGIIVVKYFHCGRPTVETKQSWKLIISKPDAGFLLFRELPKPEEEPDVLSPEECVNIDFYDYDKSHYDYRIARKTYEAELNYESMDYLYRGAPRHSALRKLGLMEWWQGKRNMFYPATTDVIHLASIAYWDIPMKYKPGQYISFSLTGSNLYGVNCPLYSRAPCNGWECNHNHNVQPRRNEI